MKVTRKYYNKSKGEWVTKVYNYDKNRYNYSEKIAKDKLKKSRGRDNRILMTKKGTIKKKMLDKYINNIMMDESLDLNERTDKVTYLKEYLADLPNRDKSNRPKGNITIDFFESHYRDGKIDRLIYNMGGDIDEILEGVKTDFSINEFNFKDENNWRGDIYTDPITGIQLRLIFDYNKWGGVSYEEIN